nr:hypothetical protein CFP56_01028 [Quercus suber]
MTCYLLNAGTEQVRELPSQEDLDSARCRSRSWNPVETMSTLKVGCKQLRSRARCSQACKARFIPADLGLQELYVFTDRCPGHSQTDRKLVLMNDT